MIKNVKLVGVGGQGTILAAKVLVTALINAEYDVKMSEIHGMSQRGGSVSSEIRFGDKVYSPVIEKGHVDYLVSFELMEAARSINYMKDTGVLLINDHKINSMVTLNGKVQYPQNIVEELSKQVDTTLISATEKAIELGNAKAMNIIMLGALVKKMKLEELDFISAIKENVKPKFIDLNIAAFTLGLKLVP
ncbi:indolepyruvate oxidoreductase subunit beta [Candidatus Izimaplasma bacterium HR1]|uniref:indolepyruvate oxidoreductase subunit beta n=1 Tax=Candidatus Izimoplasma sp. HR1 TaxID=1541959 RepID=UPI0004F58534|nr:indolepyruvate oxidoreductase subunit beta [Candidatus Izimaplasma bacterium HR1]